MFSIEHIHPIIVHFPIALILSGFLAEIVFLFFTKNPLFSVAGFWFLCAGAIAAVFAYASGAFLTKEIYGAAGTIQSRHELFAELTVFSSLADALIKIYLKAERKENGWLKWIAFSIYAVTAILVSIAGYNGGVLVFEYLLK